MNFPLYLYLDSFLAAFATALVALPLCRIACRHWGLVDEPGARKIHDQPVPLAGGVTLMIALVIPAAAAIVALDWTPNHLSGVPAFNRAIPPLLLHGLKRRGLELLAVFLGAAGMLVLGILDDRRELKPSAKFAGQLLVALLVAAAGARITLFVHSLLFSYAVTALWIVTVVNAFNFVDNMNGLCAGLGIIGAFYFFLISSTAGQYLVALIAALTCGALLGFLPYNFPRARSFLGDSGSHLVGYLLAVLAILPHFYTHKHPAALAVLSPLLVLAVPLVDLVQVVIVRWRAGKPVYVGDNNHLSHKLVRLGLSPVQAVLLLWSAAAAIGALALLWN